MRSRSIRVGFLLYFTCILIFAARSSHGTPNYLRGQGGYMKAHQNPYGSFRPDLANPEARRIVRRNLRLERADMEPPFLELQGEIDNIAGDDPDCIPDSELNSAHGRGGSDDWNPIDDCYGVYSPRCTMFARMTSGFRGRRSEEDLTVGEGYLRRQKRSAPGYPRPGGRFGLDPMSMARTNGGGRLTERDIRNYNKRSIGRGDGYSGPGNVFGRSPRNPYGSPSGMGMDVDAVDTNFEDQPPQPHPLAGNGRLRVKCSERRIRPEYAYWKTRVPEDFRRADIIRNAKKQAALRHNRERFGEDIFL